MADYLNRINRLRVLRILRNPIRRVYLARENPFIKYTAKEFKRRFRLTKGTVRWLANELKEELEYPSKRGMPLTVEQQILLTLRFYATGVFHRVSGDLFNVHESTACRTIKRVSYAIAALRPDFIQFPDEDELKNIKTEFSVLSGATHGFPGIIGAIDCTHVKVKLPRKEQAKRYFCRKQYYSLNVQVVCDARLRIRNIVCRWPGATHDSRIFTNSNLRQNLIEKQQRGELKGHLLGDGGYACTPYMLTPFRNPTTPAQERYNAAQIKARNSVERLFGIWKTRFQCLGTILRLRLETCQAVIVACAVIHNIALDAADNNIENIDVNRDRRVRIGHNPLPDDATGNLYRTSIVNRYFS